jgi:hypothetical protein
VSTLCRNKTASALLASLLAGLAACGGGSDAPSQPQAPPPASTYIVGGSVSGLAGSLVLRNGAADTLTLTANGSFSFGMALANAANYYVVVAAKPAGQSSAVNNGTGTIAGADVTNVVVACTTLPTSSGGELDATFGTGGKVTTDFSGAPPLARASSRSQEELPS